MKKYALIIFILLTIVSAYTCDMAAAMTFHNSGYFNCDYQTDQYHYCKKLILNLNDCPRNNGMGLIYYDSSSQDGIFSLREPINSNDLDFYDYDQVISTSDIMLGHARWGTTGASLPFHPFIWESRIDNKTYSFMANGDIDIDAIQDLLEAGADREWLNDAIEHLHDNSHNESIDDDDDICDSEYYFYWLIKNIEANRDIIKGMEQAIYEMNQTAEIGTDDWKNFIFSDGESLYLYRNGTGDGHEIFWGEVVVENQGNQYDQYAYAVTTTNIGEDFNYDLDGYHTDYMELDNELSNYELVILKNNGTYDQYTHFGDISQAQYRPEVSYIATNGVNWKCFPVDYSGLYADDQIEETEDYFDNLYHWAGSSMQTVIWDDMDDTDLLYTKGYKLELSNIGGFGLLQYDLEGVHVLEDREISLSSQETRFWIPYFVHGSASPYVAFQDIITYATRIQGQYWTMSRKNTSSSWTVAIDPGKSLLCYYGKMYDVTLASGHPTVMDYYDLVATSESAAYVPPETEYYQYDEKLEYEAIMVDTIVSNDPIEEVAIFENGECIGASVFTGYPVFIRAFTSELNRSPEPLEFRIYTGGRSEPEMDYRVYDEDFAIYRDEDVYPRENVITRICLGEKGEAMPVMDDIKVHTKQYPDPFNPETAIEYSIPETGKVSITIYNIKGQKVKELVDAENSAGLHKVIWNGHDDKGRKAATGLYFYELRYKGQSVREKMLMIK